MLCSSLSQAGFLRCRGGLRWTPKGRGGGTTNPPKRRFPPLLPLGFHLRTASLSLPTPFARFGSCAGLFAAVIFAFPVSEPVIAVPEIVLLLVLLVQEITFQLSARGEGDKTNPSKRRFSPSPVQCSATCYVFSTPLPLFPALEEVLIIFFAPVFFFTEITVELLLQSMQCVLVNAAARIIYPPPLLLHQQLPINRGEADLLAQIRRRCAPSPSAFAAGGFASLTPSTTHCYYIQKIFIDIFQKIL